MSPSALLLVMRTDPVVSFGACACSKRCSCGFTMGYLTGDVPAVECMFPECLACLMQIAAPGFNWAMIWLQQAMRGTPQQPCSSCHGAAACMASPLTAGWASLCCPILPCKSQQEVRSWTHNERELGLQAYSARKKVRLAGLSDHR